MGTSVAAVSGRENGSGTVYGRTVNFPTVDLTVKTLAGLTLKVPELTWFEKIGRLGLVRRDL
jgi:hypothetical protein